MDDAGQDTVVGPDASAAPPAVRAEVRSRRKQIWWLLLAGMVAAWLASWSLAEFHEEIGEVDSIGLDLRIQAMVHAHASPGMTRVMEALSFVGSPQFLVPLVAVIAALMWWRKWRRQSLLLMSSLVGAAVLDAVLKLHFKRVRPDVTWALAHEHSYSFPSGHSVEAVVLYGTLLYLCLRRAQNVWVRVVMVVTAFAMAIGIGISRIYLGVHYPSDVLAGYACGCIWLAALVGTDWWVRRPLKTKECPSLRNDHLVTVSAGDTPRGQRDDERGRRSVR